MRQFKNSFFLLQIWQYNDKSGKVQLPESANNVIGYNTERIKWTRSRLINSTGYVLLEMVGKHSHWFGRGEIRMKVICFYLIYLQISIFAIPTQLKTCGKHEPDDELPFMVHSENGTQIDLVLNRLDTVPSFSAARFGVEVVLVATEGRPSNSTQPIRFDVKLRKSLDDEHTPGVFNVINVCSPNSLANASGRA